MPIYGVQFHPERTLEEGHETFQEKKKKGLQKFFHNAHRAAKVYDPDVGATIFKNFFRTGR
jgi:GMP synthase-like glutamine amidotransferase